MASGKKNGTKTAIAATAVFIALTVGVLAVALNFDKIFIPQEPNVPAVVDPLPQQPQEEQPPEQTAPLEPEDPEPEPPKEDPPEHTEPLKPTEPAAKPEQKPAEEKPSWEVVIVDGSHSSSRPHRPSRPSTPAEPVKQEITLKNINIADWEPKSDTIEGEAQNDGLTTVTPATPFASSEQLAVDGNASSFAAGNKISLYAWTGAANEVQTDRVISGVNTYDGAKWTANPVMYWADTVTEHYFLATNKTGSIANFKSDTYTLDGSDLLIAVNDSSIKASNAVDLNFNHALAKIAVNMNFRSQFGDRPNVDSVTVSNVYTQATVDYITKTVAGTANGSIALEELSIPVTGFDRSFTAFVIPSNTEITIAVRIGNEDYIWTPTDNIEFAAGKVTTINLNVGKDEITVANAAINGWESQGDPIISAATKDEANADSFNVSNAVQAPTEKTTFANDDQIQVYGWTGDKTSVPQNPPIVSVNTLDTEGNKWAASPQMLWQNQIATHYFIGIYPYKATAPADFAADPYDLSTGDLLVALSDDRGIVANNVGVGLTFSHLLAKLNVNVNFNGATEQISGIYVETYTTANVNYLLKTVTVPSEATQSLVELTKNADGNYEGLVIPNGATRKVYIYLVDGSLYTYTRGDYIPLKSGEFTDINITIGALTAEALSEMLTADGKLTITGNLNAADLGVISAWAKETTGEGEEKNLVHNLKVLDLSGATVDGGRLPNSFMQGVTGLTEVKLPESVTELEYYAFSYCSKLAEINLENIETFGYSALSNTAIGVINLPKATSVESGVFSGNTSLTEVNLPVATTLDQSLFQGCTSLTEIHITAESFEKVMTLNGSNADPFSGIDINKKANIVLYLNASQSGNITEDITGGTSVWKWAPQKANNGGSAIYHGVSGDTGKDYVDISGFKAVYCGETLKYGTAPDPTPTPEPTT